MKKPTKPDNSKLDKTRRVKAVARERVGTPKPARVIADKRVRDKPKHKKLAEPES
jgi:hypothetical protein